MFLIKPNHIEYFLTNFQKNYQKNNTDNFDTAYKSDKSGYLDKEDNFDSPVLHFLPRYLNFQEIK